MKTPRRPLLGLTNVFSTRRHLERCVQTSSPTTTSRIGTGPRRVRTGDSGVKTHGVAPARGVVGSVSLVHGDELARIGHSQQCEDNSDNTQKMSVPSGAPSDAPT